MKQITVTGGKGGTGKSTVALLKAQEIKGKVMLVDLDVECPNLYILTSNKLENPEAFTYKEFPKINKEKCTKCGICQKVCKENAIIQPKGKYPKIVKDLCTGCGACKHACPQGAIEMKKEKSGEIFFNKEPFPLVTGRSFENIKETGPIVKQVKDFALKKAKQENIETIIFDTAAGIHCPVVNALIESDLVLAVTEPTPLGAYDLKQILKLVRKLDLSVKVIINRSDIGDHQKLEKVMQRFTIKGTEEIPFSEEILKKYSEGKLTNI